MPEPLRSPLRVLVKGASNVNWISWMGGGRSDFIFPRALEAQLIADGWPVEVRTVAEASAQTSAILRTWQTEVVNWSPDVIVLVYGQYETVHLFLPRWLERHAKSLRPRPRRLATAYRSLVLRRVWKALALLQAKVDTIVDPTIRRSRPRHVVADLERYISNVQKVGSPMVVLFELLPPASKYRPWFPGMTARIEVMNREISALVERLGKDNVRYFRVTQLVDKFFDGDVDLATPDGFHYAPEMHREVGIALAKEVETWALTQDHLINLHAPSDR